MNNFYSNNSFGNSKIGGIGSSGGKGVIDEEKMYHQTNKPMYMTYKSHLNIIAEVYWSFHTEEYQA